jgi:16S rRNA (guanine527-N7)-methyltransferase
VADLQPQLLGLLEDGLAEIGHPAAESAPEQLGRLAELVESWGARINLSGHRDAEAVARRLILDAAALASLLPVSASLADLGSGAGFPGLPLAILDPGLRVFLVESRERRHHFQRHAIRELGLENAEAIRGRFDELEPTPCELVVAQAVAAPSELVAGMRRWARPGSTLVVPTGEAALDELAHPAIERARALEYQVPLGGPRRRVWLADAV